MAELVIATNPHEASRLPYVIRVPYGIGLVFRAGDTWPRTKAVYCYPLPEWPADAEIIERVPVRSCVRRGAATDLVLDPWAGEPLADRLHHSLAAARPSSGRPHGRASRRDLACARRSRGHPVSLS